MLKIPQTASAAHPDAASLHSNATLSGDPKHWATPRKKNIVQAVRRRPGRKLPCWEIWDDSAYGTEKSVEGWRWGVTRQPRLESRFSNPLSWSMSTEVAKKEAAVFPEPIIAQQTMGWSWGRDEISLCCFLKSGLNTKTDIVWHTLTSPAVHLTDRFPLRVPFIFFRHSWRKSAVLL